MQLTRYSTISVIALLLAARASAKEQPGETTTPSVDTPDAPRSADTDDKGAKASKRPAYEVKGVWPSSYKLSLEKSVDSLPEDVRPADVATARFAVFRIKVAGDFDGLMALPLSDFSLKYKVAGEVRHAPCIGNNIWEDKWNMGKDAFYMRMNPPAETKLLFILPASVKTVTFEHRQPDGSMKVIKTGLVVPARAEPR